MKRNCMEMRLEVRAGLTFSVTSGFIPLIGTTTTTVSALSLPLSNLEKNNSAEKEISYVANEYLWFLDPGCNA